MGKGGHAMDGSAAIAMDLQAKLLGELLGGMGRSIHGGSLPCGGDPVMHELACRMDEGLWQVEVLLARCSLDASSGALFSIRYRNARCLEIIAVDSGLQRGKQFVD
jgi:hypothetical protein